MPTNIFAIPTSINWHLDSIEITSTQEYQTKFLQYLQCLSDTHPIYKKYVINAPSEVFVYPLPGIDKDDLYLAIYFIDTFLTTYAEDPLKMWQDGPEQVIKAITLLHKLDVQKHDRSLEVVDYLIARLAVNDQKLKSGLQISLMIEGISLMLLTCFIGLEERIHLKSRFPFGRLKHNAEISRYKKLLGDVDEKFQKLGELIPAFQEADKKFETLKNLSKSSDLDARLAKEIIDQYQQCDPTALGKSVIDLGHKIFHSV